MEHSRIRGRGSFCGGSVGQGNEFGVYSRLKGETTTGSGDLLLKNTLRP